MKRLWAVAIVLTIAGILPVYSQTSSTAVLGTVTDATGAVLVGAKVTLLQVQTGIKRQDTTSGTGDYNFPLVDPGEYSVTVEAPGFKTETRSGIQLELNLKARIDFH
ncbi:MAG TPA: carboxypeptidase-like regulatory domain-containing protein, partial [Bryobacteraceae bacterium]|nr:carboxypeptidase-like regulatory domain-containing protein [Bryobacteraceae bacterium]